MTEAPNMASTAVNILPEYISRNMSALVRSEVLKFSVPKQEEFVEQYKRRSKSIGTAYFCWFLWAHYLYLRQWGLLILFCLTFGGFGVWWFVDLFRIGGIITEYNKDLSADIFRELRIL